MAEPLRSLAEGQMVVLGGDRVVRVSAELAEAFADGDRLLIAGDDLLHVPSAEHEIAARAVADAVEAFEGLATCTDEQISRFFDEFAIRLTNSDVVAALLEANRADVAHASARGRSTTRLLLDDRMLADMIAGLEMWRDVSVGRDATVRTVVNEGWNIDIRRAPLGVVAFVFEGRPNVFADAAGVVRSGNTAVLRIGSDALGTAKAIVNQALRPALGAAGLPAGTMTLIESPSHAAGWSLFANDRLSLAVARGSGHAVAQLGAIASSAGVPASLHGTGGAWMIVAADADSSRLRSVVAASLDRKVCNTLNVCCVLRSAADRHLLSVADGAVEAGLARGARTVVHADSEVARQLSGAGFDGKLEIAPLPAEGLGHEWEWEDSPEFTVVVVEDVAEAVSLCNRFSPRFVVSVISSDTEVIEDVYRRVDAPFVGDGFTRWVDGQYALGEPELGLSNWEHGRLLGRGGVLTGASVHTLRLRASFADASIKR